MLRNERIILNRLFSVATAHPPDIVSGKAGQCTNNLGSTPAGKTDLFIPYQP